MSDSVNALNSILERATIKGNDADVVTEASRRITNLATLAEKLAMDVITMSDIYAGVPTEAAYGVLGAARAFKHTT